MKNCLPWSYGAWWLAVPGFLGTKPGKHAGLSLALGLFLVSMLFSACSDSSNGKTPTSPTASTQALNTINWCEKPTMVFRDEGAATPRASGTPRTITDWSLVKAGLGFTIYLPALVPGGTCLASAQATIHDSILGGSFTIGYLLPDHTSLSLSETPLRSQTTPFQCDATAATPTTSGQASTPNVAAPGSTSTPSQLCLGAKGTTSIVMSGPGPVEHLQQIFNGLQPGVNWIPAS